MELHFRKELEGETLHSYTTTLLPQNVLVNSRYNGYRFEKGSIIGLSRLEYRLDALGADLSAELGKAFEGHLPPLVTSRHFFHGTLSSPYDATLALRLSLGGFEDHVRLHRATTPVDAVLNQPLIIHSKGRGGFCWLKKKYTCTEIPHVAVRGQLVFSLNQPDESVVMRTLSALCHTDYTVDVRFGKHFVPVIRSSSNANDLPFDTDGLFENIVHARLLYEKDTRTAYALTEREEELRELRFSTLLHEAPVHTPHHDHSDASSSDAGSPCDNSSDSGCSDGGGCGGGDSSF